MDTWRKENREEYLKESRRYYQNNKETFRQKYAKYRAAHREEINKQKRKYHKERWASLRAKIFDRLGRICRCCGETGNIEFLSVDHIAGGGNQEQKKIGQWGILKKITTMKDPHSEYRILCHNCNQASGYFKVCPHEKFNVFELSK